jgi:hypothetical protein
MLTKTGLNKSNILRVIAFYDCVINIEEAKSPSMRRSMNKQCMIMSAGRETSSSHNRDKTLKPGARGLF